MIFWIIWQSIYFRTWRRQYFLMLRTISLKSYLPHRIYFIWIFVLVKREKLETTGYYYSSTFFTLGFNYATFNILKLGCRMFLVSFFNTFIELKTTMLHPSLYLVKRLLINLSGYSIPNILPDSQLYIVLFLNKGLFACKVSELMKYSE